MAAGASVVAGAMEAGAMVTVVAGVSAGAGAILDMAGAIPDMAGAILDMAGAILDMDMEDITVIIRSPTVTPEEAHCYIMIILAAEEVQEIQA